MMQLLHLYVCSYGAFSFQVFAKSPKLQETTTDTQWAGRQSSTVLTT